MLFPFSEVDKKDAVYLKQQHEDKLWHEKEIPEFLWSIARREIGMELWHLHLLSAKQRVGGGCWMVRRVCFHSRLKFESITFTVARKKRKKEKQIRLGHSLHTPPKIFLEGVSSLLAAQDEE